MFWVSSVRLPLQNLPLAQRNKYRSVSHTPCLTIRFFFLCRSCFSAIGRQGGKQRISVGEGCEYKGTVMHEMMHALGFFHEQSRTDRDDYVMVLWWNVEPGTMRAKAKSNCMRNNMTKHWNINNQNSQAGYLCSLQSCLVSFSLENNERKATPCKVIQGCLPFIKKTPEILVGNFWSVRTVRVVYHLPKISGLSRRAWLDSSYNMKLVRNSRNLYMVNEFLFLTSQSGKPDYLFRISVCPGNFPVKRTKKTFTIYIPTGISGNLW